MSIKPVTALCTALLVGSLMSTVSNLPIDKVTFIDRDLGVAGDNNLAVKAASQWRT